MLDLVMLAIAAAAFLAGAGYARFCDRLAVGQRDDEASTR